MHDDPEDHYPLYPLGMLRRHGLVGAQDLAERLPSWSETELREAFWPAVWPAVFMLATLEGLERLPPAGLIEVGIHLAVAGAVYAGLFVRVAIGANERRFYWTKIRSLLERRGRAPVAA